MYLNKERDLVYYIVRGNRKSARKGSLINEHELRTSISIDRALNDILLYLNQGDLHAVDLLVSRIASEFSQSGSIKSRSRYVQSKILELIMEEIKSRDAQEKSKDVPPAHAQACT